MEPQHAAAQYRRAFGHDPAVVAQAPGRVNIIGEHVDYNDGLVLPFAIAQRIVVAAGPGDSGFVTARSEPLQSDARFAVDVTIPAEPYAWENYIRGMVFGLREAGAELAGANLWIGGDLPTGSGMSSSAALCVATGMALAQLGGADVPPKRMAKIAQSAEHNFAGTPCGLMDQMAACFGRADHALLLDCRDLSHEDVPCVPEGVTLLVIPSGVKHALADGAYEKRVRACRNAVNQIAEDQPGVKALRDVSPDVLTAYQDRLDDESFKRARHVVSELARLVEAVTALKGGDWARVGELLWQTQDSLRDDYEVSCVEIDELIELLHRHRAVLGARMVGGGFGGIVLAIVDAEEATAVEEAVHQGYYEPRGLADQPFVVTPSAGASVSAVPDPAR